MEVAEQRRLVHGKVIRRGRHDRVATGGGRSLGQGERLGQRRIGDPDQHGDAAVDVFCRRVDHLPAKRNAERGTFARRAEDEDPMHPAADDMLNEPYQTSFVQLALRRERGRQRGDNASHGLGHVVRHIAARAE